MIRRSLVLLLVVPAALAAPAASGQSFLFGRPGPASAAKAAGDAGDERDRPAPDSPRRSVEEFLDLARVGKNEEASRFLAAPGKPAEERAELARELKEVLDRRLWIDLETLSGAPEGDREDRLPPNVEDLGSIPLEGSRDVPMRLVRVTDDEGARWVFSAATVSHVPALYESLPDRWMREHLPPWLLRMGPRELAWWQWLALVPFGLAAWLGGRILGRIECAVLGRVVRRTRREWDDLLTERLHGPLVLASAVVVARILLPSLALPIAAEGFVLHMLVAMATASLFWAAWRSVDVVEGALASLPFAARNASARNLLKVGSNMAKGVAATLGVLAVLAGLGLPVATLVAGVGLGSLALAFGAQKTVENVFGSIALAIDQPFRVGDTVTVDDFTATVENIGLRSTRFRTAERTVITIPNGLVANMRLETLATRDRLRLTAVLGIVQETPRDAVARVVEAWRTVLREHPHIWPEGISVVLARIGESSLEVDVAAWFATSAWDEFLAYRQEVLLGFLEAAEREGVALAHPTRTVLVSSLAPPGLPGGAAAAHPAMTPPSAPAPRG